MPVKKLFWINPYMAECIAVVTSVNDSIITLDQTVAYAFEGGQQSDIGTIGGYEIVNAEKQDLEIYYTLPVNHTLSVGDNVKVLIDWEKRYNIMCLHFAAELVLELIYQNYNHPEKIGANITYNKARVDFCWEGNISETFSFLNSELKKMIDADLDITSLFSDKENERRYWEIPNFARVACGGTHIRKTGEIGALKLKRINVGKGKERIEIYLCDTACLE